MPGVVHAGPPGRRASAAVHWPCVWSSDVRPTVRRHRVCRRCRQERSRLGDARCRVQDRANLLRERHAAVPEDPRRRLWTS